MVRAMTNANPFGPLEDKSLPHDDIETKDLGGTPAVAPRKDPAPDGEVTVVMIHHDSFGDAQLVPGQTVSLPAHVADRLIGAKRAKKV